MTPRVRPTLVLSLVLTAAMPLVARSADDLGASPSISVLPASGVAHSGQPSRQFGNVQNNLGFDGSKQAQREYESRLRAITPTIDFTWTSTPGPRNGAKSPVTVIPRATAPGPDAAPYTPVDRMGGEWGAATANMPVQQARDYEARVQFELAERDKRTKASRHPEVRFTAPPGDAPAPSAADAAK
jgi:hypothetical protein